VIRSFVAVDIPDRLRRSLQDLLGTVARLGLDAKLTQASSIHLTLKFLGEIEESRVEPLGRTLASAVGDVSRFPIRIRRVGSFPERGVPRVVWVGIDDAPQLGELQGRVDRALSELGFPAEAREFKAHLTLARLRSGRGLERLKQFLESEGRSVDLGEFFVDQVHLYQSVLRPEGALYRKLKSVDLTE